MVSAGGGVKTHSLTAPTCIAKVGNSPAPSQPYCGRAPTHTIPQCPPTQGSPVTGNSETGFAAAAALAVRAGELGVAEAGRSGAGGGPGLESAMTRTLPNLARTPPNSAGTPPNPTRNPRDLCLNSNTVLWLLFKTASQVSKTPKPSSVASANGTPSTWTLGTLSPTPRPHSPATPKWVFLPSLSTLRLHADMQLNAPASSATGLGGRRGTEVQLAEAKARQAKAKAEVARFDAMQVFFHDRPHLTVAEIKECSQKLFPKE
ncbi:hypothetical protein BDK51DRAFT_43533 [Blyttiomyces helicus]|uniref:Uncharacterized protein n=1 Tax=Blyttiomyces helicus TaxID=388810 RepID=A0A4V1IRB3_9FUNG|nr:hypothetical protein BDK51DRAFT_43533 [Blyttiomyces helicus]|eukprot:RKO89457.1 hypothetical protein BDK51DRAFT_43533 [Blyttiomyces helicus]